MERNYGRFRYSNANNIYDRQRREYTALKSIFRGIQLVHKCGKCGEMTSIDAQKTYKLLMDLKRWKTKVTPTGGKTNET